MWLRYVRAEAGRRRLQVGAAGTVVAIAVAAAAVCIGMSDGLRTTERNALSPLVGVGSDILITGRDPTNQAEALQYDAAIERERSSVVLDLSKLGPPGTHFSHDFLMPEASPLLPASLAADVRQMSGVSKTAVALVATINHVDGIVPDIVASYTAPPAVVDQSPPTPQEQQQIQACERQAMLDYARNHPQPPPKTAGSSGPGSTITFGSSFYSCLPARFSRVEIEQRVFKEVVAPPKTDIGSSSFRIGGVDTSVHDLGLLTSDQIEHGRSLASPTEAVVAASYAARNGVHVGSTLLISGSSYQVVGLATPPPSGLAFDVYLDVRALQRIMAGTDEYSMLMVRVTSANDVDRVAREIAEAFPEANVITSSVVASLVSGSLVDASEAVNRYEASVTALLLGSAVFVVAASTMWAIAQRTTELATLRALGWSRRRISTQIVLETMTIAGAGALFGAVAGAAGNLLISSLHPALVLSTGRIYAGMAAPHVVVHVAAVPTVSAALTAAVLSIGAGSMAALVAILRTASLAPAAAYRGAR